MPPCLFDSKKILNEKMEKKKKRENICLFLIIYIRNICDIDLAKKFIYFFCLNLILLFEFLNFGFIFSITDTIKALIIKIE